MYSQLIYYYKNKSKKIEYQKNYNKFHKDKIKIYYKEYYIKNKIKILERIKQNKKIDKIDLKIENVKTIIYFN